MKFPKTVVALIVGVPAALCSCVERHTVALPPDYAKIPVLFVHGSGLDARTWDAMIDYLESKGYPRDYLGAVNLLPNDGSNVRAAEMFIAPAVEDLLEKAGELARGRGGGVSPEKVDIVAHSMGAASSRWYTVKIAPERVRTWVSIAGANHGTDALRRYPSPGNDEMVPAFATSEQESALQVALNGTPLEPRDETPHGLGDDPSGIPSVPPDVKRSVLYCCLYTDPDAWIEPASSAQLLGAGGISIETEPGALVAEISDGNFRIIGFSDHDSLPSFPEVMRLVKKILGARDHE